MKRKTKKESKRSIEKKLKKTTKEALKAGLTSREIVGIILGSIVVLGSGATTGVLVTRDPEFYNAFKTNMRENPFYEPNWYEKIRGYPKKLYLEDSEIYRIEQNKKRIREIFKRRGIEIPWYLRRT